MNVDPAEPLPLRIRRLKIEEYLLSQRCTLWPGAGFDITDEKERAQAVVFLERILDGLG